MSADQQTLAQNPLKQNNTLKPSETQITQKSKELFPNHSSETSQATALETTTWPLKTRHRHHQPQKTVSSTQGYQSEDRKHQVRTQTYWTATCKANGGRNSSSPGNHARRNSIAIRRKRPHQTARTSTRQTRRAEKTGRARTQDPHRQKGPPVELLSKTQASKDERANEKRWTQDEKKKWGRRTAEQLTGARNERGRARAEDEVEMKRSGAGDGGRTRTNWRQDATGGCLKMAAQQGGGRAASLKRSPARQPRPPRRLHLAGVFRSGRWGVRSCAPALSNSSHFVDLGVGQFPPR